MILKIKVYLKKHWSNVLFGALILLLIIPATGIPIKVFINRLFTFSPSMVEEQDRMLLSDYHWELSSLEGVPLNFARSKGKVVIVNVWATWCPPCIAELPSLERLYKKYGNRVDFYFVSQESKDVLQKFLAKKGYDIPVFQFYRYMPEELSTTSLPTTYLISANGEIVIVEKGAADWDSDKVITLLDSLLK